MDFSNPHFAEPGWLWLAVLGPVLLLLLHHHAAAARRAQLNRVASPRFVERLTRSHSRARRRFKNALLVLSVAALGIALARPQWGELSAAHRALGEDVVFMLDCSRSMLATDVRPDRLERAKLAILDFVRRYGRGRVGLVTFAGSAFLQCPLTLDYDAFDQALEAADNKTIPVPGTNIGRALEEAYHAMDKHSRRKLLVLVTDGEDLQRTGIAAAKSLATNNVTVFTIGVGSPAGTVIQYVDSSGKTRLVRDARGHVVHSRLDEKTLRAIARATGGQYFPLGPLGEGLARVRSAVATLDRSTGSAGVPMQGVERFYVPIAAALVLIVVESLISTRRRGKLA